MSHVKRVSRCALKSEISRCALSPNNMKSIFTDLDLNYGLKVFAISFGLVFLMVLFPKLGITSKLLNPAPNKATGMEIIKPKLSQIPNNFKVKEGVSLVKTSYAASDFDQASSYIVIDFNSGKVLLQKDADKKLPIASLTKLMSAVVALDISSPSEAFQVSESASKIEPTRMGVITGEKMTLEELLNGGLLTSANDAMEVIKEGIDQDFNQSVFVDSMNQKAKDIGLSNSHFTNPQGFDNPNHYSSASDLAVLSHYALTNYPLIAGIVKKDYQFLPSSSSHKQFDLYNWNGLLDVYPGVEGVKIGNTDEAGYTDIVLSERNGKKVLAVVLGAPGVLERDLWAGELLDSGFNRLGEGSANITETQLRAKYSSWKYWN